MKLLLIPALLLLSLQSFSNEFFNTQSQHSPPLETVENVDLDRYLGKWFEIASFPQRFQRGCTATTAEYSKRRDGDIKVINKCKIGSPSGRLKKATGRAWIVDRKSNAKLKVQFFLTRFRIPFLAGNYWILDLGEDYEYALVGDKSRKFLWVLARRSKIDESLYEQIIEKAQSLMFDTSKLVRTKH